MSTNLRQQLHEIYEAVAANSCGRSAMRVAAESALEGGTETFVETLSASGVTGLMWTADGGSRTVGGP